MKEAFFKVTLCAGIICIALSNILSGQVVVTGAVMAGTVCVLCFGSYLCFPSERATLRRPVVAYSTAAVAVAAALALLPGGVAAAVTAVIVLLAYFVGRTGPRSRGVGTHENRSPNRFSRRAYRPCRVRARPDV